MNGFEVFTEGAGGLGVDPVRVVPPGCETSYAYRTTLPGHSLLTWGNVNGDIHVAQDADSFLVLSGYIVGMNPSRRLDDQNDTAEVCLAKVNELSSMESLAEWLRSLHGSFGIFYRNRTRRLTLCITDRAASRPLWRRWHSAGWLVSSHSTPIALSTSSRKFDETALGALLLYGGPVNPRRSLISGVEGSPPGSIVSLGESGKLEEYRWYRFKHRPDDHLSLAEWVDLISQHLIRAASRLAQSGEKIAVFFSGGTDSRLAAAALKAAGGDPLLVTLGDGENLEVKVAHSAAKALGLRHKVILRDPEWYLRSLPRAVFETGGNYAWIHGHFADAAANVAAEYGIDSFVLGDLCEAFSKLCCSVDQVPNGGWSSERFVAGFDSLRMPLYRPANRDATLSIINPRIRPDIEHSVRQEIRDLYTSISADCADPRILGDQCMRWDSIQTIPTFFMFLDLRSRVRERNMMFDFDAHELLERIPSAFRNEINLGALLIRKLHGRAAWVVNSNSMLPMVLPPKAHQFARRVKPVLGKLRRSVLGDGYRTTGSWPKHSVLYAKDREWRRHFESVLNSADAFDEELFDRDAIKVCWNEFLLGNPTRVGDVERLLQLGMLSRVLDG